MAGRLGQIVRRRRIGIRGRRDGFSLLEVMIAMAIISTVLVSVGGAFLTSMKAVRASQRTSRGSVFLQTVMEDLSAQTYEALPAFNGNRIVDQATVGASDWAVDLTVFLAAVDLEQVDATLTDLRSNRVLARVSTLRSRR